MARPTKKRAGKKIASRRLLKSQLAGIVRLPTPKRRRRRRRAAR